MFSPTNVKGIVRVDLNSSSQCSTATKPSNKASSFVDDNCLQENHRSIIRSSSTRSMLHTLVPNQQQKENTTLVEEFTGFTIASKQVERPSPKQKDPTVKSTVKSSRRHSMALSSPAAHRRKKNPTSISEIVATTQNKNIKFSQLSNQSRTLAHQELKQQPSPQKKKRRHSLPAPTPNVHMTAAKFRESTTATPKSSRVWNISETSSIESNHFDPTTRTSRVKSAKMTPTPNLNNPLINSPLTEAASNFSDPNSALNSPNTSTRLATLKPTTQTSFTSQPLQSFSKIPNLSRKGRGHEIPVAPTCNEQKSMHPPGVEIAASPRTEWPWNHDCSRWMGATPVHRAQIRTKFRSHYLEPDNVMYSKADWQLLVYEFKDPFANAIDEAMVQVLVQVLLNDQTVITDDSRMLAAALRYHHPSTHFTAMYHNLMKQWAGLNCGTMQPFLEFLVNNCNPEPAFKKISLAIELCKLGIQSPKAKYVPPPDRRWKNDDLFVAFANFCDTKRIRTLELYNLIERNHDGSCSKKSFARKLLDLEIQMTPPMVRELLEAIDSEGNGIDYTSLLDARKMGTRKQRAASARMRPTNQTLLPLQQQQAKGDVTKKKPRVSSAPPTLFRHGNRNHLQCIQLDLPPAIQVPLDVANLSDLILHCHYIARQR